MNVPEIIKVKDLLNTLTSKGQISDWELPYENLLTRLDAAIFFFEPSEDKSLKEVEKVFSDYEEFSYRQNGERKLSQLSYRLTFSEEEKEKNNSIQLEEEVS